MVLLCIYLYNYPCMKCLLTRQCLLSDENFIKKQLGLAAVSRIDLSPKLTVTKISDRKSGIIAESNAYFLKVFLTVIVHSKNYRALVLENVKIKSRKRTLALHLHQPKQEILDYAWSERVLVLIWTRVELENAMFWLSTLGGAFSALGDYFQHWADRAGQISMRQYRISKMLGDESLAARSRLYASLAIAQKGQLQTAKAIIRSVNEYAKETQDDRLHKMCKGVWAKFKYMALILKNPELINNTELLQQMCQKKCMP